MNGTFTADPSPALTLPATTAGRAGLTGTWVAWAVAVAALLGSLWLSIGMKLEACPLCFYQRTFVMGVVGVLTVGLLTGARRSGYLSLLALPLAAGGLGVAVFHVSLEARGRLECPDGLLGAGSAPQQSLAALALLFVVVAVDAVRQRKGLAWVAAAGATALGALFTLAAVNSVPSPKIPDKPYDPAKQPLVGCRVPFAPP
jgi:disulfide bond formation protein DsbB